MYDLNSLIDPSLGWVLQEATGINDSGQIVGYGTGPSGQTDAFLLTPTPSPEPSTLCLSIACACSLLASHLCGRRRSNEQPGAARGGWRARVRGHLRVVTRVRHGGWDLRAVFQHKCLTKSRRVVRIGLVASFLYPHSGVAA